MDNKPKTNQVSPKIIGLTKNFITHKKCPEVKDISGFQYEYWYEFKKYVLSASPPITTDIDPHSNLGNLFPFSIGKADIHLEAYLEWEDCKISVILWLPMDRYSKDWILDLQNKCQIEIKKTYGEAFVWGRTIYNTRDQGARAISISRRINITDRGLWEEQFAWFYKQIVTFRQIFGDWSQNIDLKKYRL